MRMRLVLGLLALLVIALSSPRPALAVPIDIGGTVRFVSSQGGATVTLAGDRGFTVSASVPDVLANFGPWESCTPCRPGDPINVDTFAIHTAFHGGATLDGITYGLGGVDGPSLGLHFFGPPLFAPPINVAPIVALTSPVNFSGTFSHQDDRSQPFQLEQLMATATITVVIERSAGCGTFANCWELNSATYELAPTPEPTTLLLFGTTMAGIGLARWRRRKLK